MCLSWLQVWKNNLDKGLSVLGIKLMGELDVQPFKIACYQKFHSAHVAQQKASQYCSLWQSKLADPSWHPLKIIVLDGGETEVYTFSAQFQILESLFTWGLVGAREGRETPIDLQRGRRNVCKGMLFQVAISAFLYN